MEAQKTRLEIKADLIDKLLMKILILAYDFPPLTSVGSFRPYSWYKYFPDAGVYPIVITRYWAEKINSIEDRLRSSETEVKKHETSESLLIQIPHQNSLKEKLILKNGLNKKIFLRKTLTLLEEIFKYSVSYLDDKHYIYKYADQFLKENKVDCILTSGEPFILFKYAYNLSKKYNIPWFADYRDGWTTNHSRKDIFPENLIKKYSAYFEKKYTQNAIGFCSVSADIVKKIEELISREGFVVPNGADLDLINSVAEIIPNNDVFTITFTGLIYEGQRVQEFLNAIENFIKKYPKRKLLVKFIGIDFNPNNCVSKIKRFAEIFPQNFTISPRLSHKESILEQKSATVLLNFILGSQSEGLIGGKTYEYFAIRKPIIVIPQRKETNPPLFPDRNIQMFAYTSDDIEKLLEKLYLEFLNGKSLKTNITDDELYSISRKKNALDLAEKIKIMVNKN